MPIDASTVAIIVAVVSSTTALIGTLVGSRVTYKTAVRKIAADAEAAAAQVRADAAAAAAKLAQDAKDAAAKLAHEDREAWLDETRKIREEMRHEMDRQAATLERQTQKIMALELENQNLRSRVAALEGERDHATDGLGECLNDLAESRKINDTLRDEVAYLNLVIDAVLTLLDIQKHGRDPVEGAGMKAGQKLDDFLNRANRPIIERKEPTT